MSGPLHQVPIEALIECLVDHCTSTSIDTLDVEPLIVMRKGSPCLAAVAVEIPGRCMTISADTGRRAAVRLSGANRNGAALALFDACDLAEASCQKIETLRRAA